MSRKTVCLFLVFLIGFMTSLPRLEQTLTLYTSAFSFLHSSEKSIQGKTASMLKGPKLRWHRFIIAFFRLPAPSVSASGPSIQLSRRFLSDDHLYFSRIPDPLIHPPA
jgi:hypothetical protein